MIYNHAITRAVAQARISDLIAQATADGRAQRVSPAWWCLCRRRSAARVVTAEAAEPTGLAARRTRVGKVPRPPALTAGADSLQVSFERYDLASNDGGGVELEAGG